MASYLLEDGDLVQTNILMTQNGQRLINTFHWRVELSVSPPDGPFMLGELNDLLFSDGTWFLQESRSLTVDGLKYDYLTSQKVRPSRWRAERLTLNTTGVSNNPGLPQNLAVSLSRWGVNSYRGATGRVQVPGIDPDHLVNGELTNTAMALWEDVAATLTFTMQPATGVNFVPVLSRLVGGTGYSFQYVEGAAAQRTSRVMRRRTVHVGQ